MWIAQDPAGKGIAAVDACPGQGSEGVLIAPTGPLHELGLHRALRIGATDLVASPSMEPAEVQTFSRAGDPPGRGPNLEPLRDAWATSLATRQVAARSRW